MSYRKKLYATQGFDERKEVQGNEPEQEVHLPQLIVKNKIIKGL